MSRTCARQECGNAVHDKDYIVINSPIGSIVIHLCAIHYVEYMRAHLVVQLEKIESNIRSKYE